MSSSRAPFCKKLIVIGEAAARLPRSFTERHPEIEWVDIVAFRNIAVHEYFAVDWKIVWVTATEDVPLLREKDQKPCSTGLRRAVRHDSRPPEGCKVAEPGPLPGEWRVVRPEEAVQLTGGQKPPKPLKTYRPGSLPYLTADSFRTRMVKTSPGSGSPGK